MQVEIVKAPDFSLFVNDILLVEVDSANKSVNIHDTGGAQHVITCTTEETWAYTKLKITDSFHHGPSVTLYEDESMLMAVLEEAEKNRRKPGENPKIY